MPVDLFAALADPATDILLSELSPKDNVWDIHKSSADKVSSLYDQVGYSRYSDRVADCSNLLEFGLTPVLATDPSQLKFKLRGTRFCRVRLCPVCQWRRSVMWQARMFQALPEILESYPKHKFIFLTLTLKNCPIDELRDTLKTVNIAWQRLVQRKIFPGLGWVKSVEVTRSKRDDTAHPHIHALIMVKPSYITSRDYLSQKAWTELWQSCLKIDYTPIVNIKVVKPKKGVEGETEGLKAAIVEVTKYSVKEDDLTGNGKSTKHTQLSLFPKMTDAEWLQQLTRQLHKTRSIAIGGVLKDFMSDQEPEDLVSENEDGEQHQGQVYFGWRERMQRYTKE